MCLFDIEIPTKTGKDTLVDDLYESMSKSIKDRLCASERKELFRNCRTIEGFRDILQMNFDMDKTFEKQCYLEGKYLCTVAHNVDDKYTGYLHPGTKTNTVLRGFKIY